MTVEQHRIIDFVALDAGQDVAILVMVEDREWGDAGALLPDLQEKLNTYFAYVTEGQLAADYPDAGGKPVRMELRTMYPPGERELEFLRIVTEAHLRPAGIGFAWKLIGVKCATDSMLRNPTGPGLRNGAAGCDDDTD